jgi:signal transduction histidine kinase
MPGRLRWLAVLLPALVIGLIELLSDTVLDPYLPFGLDALVVVAVVVVLAAVFAQYAFGKIDRLAADLGARNAEVEARAATASALHQVSLAIASVADLDAVLQTTVDNARRLLGTDVAMLVLVGADGEPTLRATSGSATAFDRTGGQPGDDLHRFVRANRMRSILAAPLRRGGTTIGTLAVGGRSDRAHGVDDVETLSSLATQAAIAIENARLQLELREHAIRDERERIAGEIHDGLAQVLGYVNTKSQAVEGLLEAGRLDEARVQMSELAAAARSIYVDVREAILGLTSQTLANDDLVGQVRAYAVRFAEASKLATRVETDPATSWPTLPPQVRVEVFGIVREALTNVRKHAAAGRVTIRLATEDDGLIVEVADDGRGFDPSLERGEADDWPHYGLTAMRRRAATIGGELHWQSAPGAGTTVRLAIPVPSPLGVAGS